MIPSSNSWVDDHTGEKLAAPSALDSEPTLFLLRSLSFFIYIYIYISFYVYHFNNIYIYIYIYMEKIEKQSNLRLKNLLEGKLTLKRFGFDESSPGL